MATTPVSDQKSKKLEKVCQVEVPQQEQPNFNLPKLAAKKNVVGFNCEFVERLPEAFQVECPICLLVLRESHQATCCGNNFCQPCIEHVQADNKPCPTCSTAEFSVVSIIGFQRSLYKLHVYCSHKKEGCQWTSELGELDKHLNENPILGEQFIGCEFVEVECNDCGKSFQRQHFKAHQLEQHPFSCGYCHNYESYFEDVVKNHYPICGSRPVPCPNECGVYPEHQNLEHHVSKECSLVEVNCDFNYAGCEVKLLRKDMPAHLAENVMLHMSQQATYNQKKVQEKDQQIMQLTEDLRKELEANRRKIDQLKGVNETLSKSLLEKKEEIAQLREDACAKEEILKQAITELRQKQDNAVTEEEAQKKDEALQHEIATVKREIAELQQERRESENKLKTTEEEAQKKNETLQHEIAELREKSASKEENDTLSKSLLKLQEDVRVKEEATRHTNELLKQEIAQLRQKQDDATSGIHMRYKEIDTLKEESTQLQEHLHKKDEAMRQEIVDLKQELQESENKLKTTEEEAQKKNETLQHEIAELREKSASKEENDTLSKSLLKLQEDVRVKEEATRHTNELLKQEIAQLRQKQDDATSGIHMRYKEIDTLKEESTQLQEHLHKKDEAMRQEIVDLKQELQESENKLKTTEKEAQKKDETLQHEIAARRMEDAVSKEESEAIKQEIAELRERIEKNEAVKQEVIQVGKKQEETVSKEDYETTKQELTQLKAKQEEDWSSLQSYTGPPIDRKMTEFEKHNQDGDEWYSEPFYTHPYGYKMCLNVNANGAEPGKGKHISVFCYLMRGKFDDRLRWPFQGHITVQLINHLEDKEHYTATLDFSNADSDLANRVVTRERAPNGKGTIKFLPHSELGHDSAKNRQFLKDDCLCFRVNRVTNLNWTSLERQCLVMESRVCVPPFEFTMRDFEQLKTDNDIWYSPSFYTHERGYRMCVRVHVNGDDAAKGEHVSVFIHLMRGEWDNYLKWPFRGGITIQLLNQTEDKEHCENICEYSDTVADAIAGRVTTTERAQEFGWPRFISHDALNYDKTKNCQYLKYDSLQFRIANVEPKK